MYFFNGVKRIKSQSTNCNKTEYMECAMRVKTFFRFLRIVSAVVLFFFVWTFSEIWQAVAWAAAPAQVKTTQARSEKPKPASAAEQFEAALEGLMERIGKTGEKAARNEDITEDLGQLKTVKAAIEALDGELRKEFSNTEKRLIDSKLPKEILARHAAFVKNCENNLSQLKTEIDDLDKAKTKADRKSKIEKVRLHLEKTKAPSRHQKLDPENLPFRARKAAKAREPRLKKEDFKEFGPQKRTNLAADEHRLTQIASGMQDAGFRMHDKNISYRSVQKPLLLAYNAETATDAPLSFYQKPETRNAELEPFSTIAFSEPILNIESGTLNLAQAVGAPTADDLAQTPDVQFTSEIRAKAQELGYNPVKIYEYVRNNIEYAPLYGSIQGADQCLQSKICNDFDTASILIALLRVSGISARYVYGTVDIPMEQAMNWVGGVTDPKMVGTILATNGVPVTLLKTSSGVYKYVRMERVLVSAFIDYIPSRGAVHKQGDTWIPLDPSFKQYDFKHGMDLYTAMGINGEQYLQSYITDTSSLTIPTELQASFPAYTISPYQYYSKRLFNYLDTNFPSATYQDVFGADTIEASRAIIKKEYPYLMGTLPYSVVTQGASFAFIPDSLRHKVNFLIGDTTLSDASLTYTASLPEIAGKRITLSSVPATASDESLVNQYGTMLNVPPYLLSVKMALKINGIAVATGSPAGLGKVQTFNMSFTIPNIGTEIVINTVTAGDYSAIPIISCNVPFTLVGDKMETLINNIGSSDLDDLLGQMLYNVGVSYFHHLNFEEELYAKNFKMIITKGLSEAIVTSHAETDSLWGVPYKISEGGIGIDVGKNEYFPFPYDGSSNRARDFMIVSGLGSSAWEDRVLQAFYDVPSVSAARLLRYASQQGVLIYTIDGTNISDILPQLLVSSQVLDDIKNAVNASKKVIISKTGVQYEGMDSIGYIVLDPGTGAAGYMISGGLAGGMSSQPDDMSVRDITQYLRDGSALRTIYGRSMVVMYALAQLGTPYRTGFEDPGPMGGADPDKGFDCSGLIYYLFTTVYNKHIFGPERLWTVDRQHRYLLEKKMTHLYEEKLDGDILWSDNYGHTGIYYGIHALLPGETLVTDSVIHANRGKWFSAVIITSTNNAAFTGAPSGSRMPDIGRPVP